MYIINNRDILGEFKNEQSRDTGNIGHKTQNKEKQNKKHNNEK